MIIDDVLKTDDGFSFDLKKAFEEVWDTDTIFRKSFDEGGCGGFVFWFPGQYIAVTAERAYRKEKNFPVDKASPPEWQKNFRKIGQFVESKYKEWSK